jgi:RNA polymerase sigma-70 factor (ECF subfamily)
MLKVIQINNNSELIKKSLQNNRRAQKKLFERFSPKMLGLCTFYIRDKQQAEEVMLNGFFKVFTRLHQYSGKGSFEGWIRKIMVFECISHLRQNKKLIFTDRIERFETVIENEIEMNIAVEDLFTLISELPERCRIVFNLYVIEGYKHHEIAEMLNISAGTSKTQLFRARKSLKEMISSNPKRYYERG